VDSGNGFGTRVFWTAVIPDSDVQIEPGAGRAEMHVRNLAILNYYSPTGFVATSFAVGPQWQTTSVPATTSFDVVWNGPVTRRVNVKDTVNDFAGEFNENQATVTWSAQSSSGFSFTSNPGNFSTSVPGNFFAQVGQERNGNFFPGGGGAAAPPGPTAPPQLIGQQLVLSPIETSVAAAEAVSSISPRHQATTPLSATGVGDAQHRQPVSAPRQLTADPALSRVVDHVFANQNGSTISETLRNEEILAWAV
jgi:hypothetical protein